MAKVGLEQANELVVTLRMQKENALQRVDRAKASKNEIKLKEAEQELMDTSSKFVAAEEAAKVPFLCDYAPAVPRRLDPRPSPRTHPLAPPCAAAAHAVCNRAERARAIRTQAALENYAKAAKMADQAKLDKERGEARQADEEAKAAESNAAKAQMKVERLTHSLDDAKAKATKSRALQDKRKVSDIEATLKDSTNLVPRLQAEAQRLRAVAVQQVRGRPTPPVSSG